MTFKVEIEREEDGRWIAEVCELPGVLVYGDSLEQARAKAQAGYACSYKTNVSNRPCIGCQPANMSLISCISG